MAEEKIEEKIEGVIAFEDFIKVQLRVAKILEATPHPNADKLMVLRVQLNDGERQIVAGIRQHYSAESLNGMTILVVTNLEPRKLRGLESHGMVLAASDDKGRLSLLTPDKPVDPGSKVQ